MAQDFVIVDARAGVFLLAGIHPQSRLVFWSGLDARKAPASRLLPRAAGPARRVRLVLPIKLLRKKHSRGARGSTTMTGNDFFELLGCLGMHPVHVLVPLARPLLHAFAVERQLVLELPTEVSGRDPRGHPGRRRRLVYRNRPADGTDRG